MSGVVGVIGSRALPVSFSPLVSRVVSHLLSQGYSVASGGALGADSYALSALISQGASSRGIVFSPWVSMGGFPASVRPQVGTFLSQGGKVVWGSASPGSSRRYVISALLSRNCRLVSSSSYLVAFLYGSSSGSLYTICQAVRRSIPVVVFLCGGGASLPPDLSSRCSVVDGTHQNVEAL